ncbi:MAG: hypothetical protein IJH62_03375 [Mogibacterium sp.]|nr:hypothetical protein [Mogibacterium sp.]
MTEKEPITVLTIDWDSLKSISYQSNLGKSLKNTLRKFDKEDLFDDIESAISYFTEIALEEVVHYPYRVKSLQSCMIKYEKYYPSTAVEKAFNDLLGIRIIIGDYSDLDSLQLPEKTKVVDMRNGKAIDDGYRGVHIYFQKDHSHYPIEIQFMTPFDRQFNEWLHIYVYKYIEDASVGRHLRDLYEQGVIKDEESFRKEMQKCAT